jgi:hypothetical protein
VRPTSNGGRPSLEEDQQALLGLWVQPRASGASPKVLSFPKGSHVFPEGYVRVCDLGSLSPYAMFGISFVLAEEGGQRHRLDIDDRVVLFTYRLDGDTLELERVVPADYGDNYNYDLGGKWLRFRYPPDAEPAAAPDRGDTKASSGSRPSRRGR